MAHHRERQGSRGAASSTSKTLQQTNQMLIDTMDEVLTIQQEGPPEASGRRGGKLKVIEKRSAQQAVGTAQVNRRDMACFFREKPQAGPRFVLIVCILASIILFGGGRAAQRALRPSCRCFSDGNGTPRSPCATAWKAYLQRCAERANALAETGCENSARTAALVDEVARGGGGPPNRGGEDLDERHTAYQRLVPAVEALYTALEQGHSADDLVGRAPLPTTTFKGAVNLIQNDQ